MASAATGSVVEQAIAWPVPLSEAQEGLWYAQRIDPANPIFNTGQYLDLRGTIDVAAWCRAVAAAMAEADGLAIRIVDDVDGPVQIVDEARRAVPEVIDLRSSPDGDAAALGRIERDMSTALDLAVDRLVTEKLFLLADDRAIWYQRVHHLVIDGYGTALLTRRICDLYTAQVTGVAAVGVPFGPYAAVLAEDRDYRASARRAADAEFWRAQFAGAPDVVGLASGPAMTSHTCLRQTVVLDASCALALRRLAGATPWPDALVAIVAAYLARHTDREEVIVGVPTMGRLGSAAARVPAMVMNVLPVSVSVDEDAPVHDYVAGVSRRLRECRRHERYRGEQLRRDLGLVGQHSRLYGPLVNVLPFERVPELPGLQVSVTTLGTGPVDDLTFTFRADGREGAILLDVEANPALYAGQQVADHARRLAVFIDAAVRAERLATVPTVTTEEADRWIDEVNQSAHAVPDVTLTTLIEAAFQRRRTAPAVVSADGVLTYDDVDRRTAALRDALASAGVRRGDVVAVVVPRSADLVLSLVAILRAGAAYLPLDPASPPDRMAAIVRLARPRVVLATETVRERLGDTVPVLLVTHAIRAGDAADTADTEPVPLESPVPEDAAYVIFTSGSTGEPKGVVVEHRAIVNRLEWMRAHYGIGPDDCILQKTPATFDVSVWEFFLPFLAGATLAVAPAEAHKDPAWIVRLIREYAVTTIHFVPSMLALFLAEPSAASLRLRRVFCSGEALPAPLRDRCHEVLDAELHNLYGPTEAAVDVTWWDASRGDRSDPVPIGRPVWNTRMYVLDRRLRALPAGVSGDLYIAGVQLAREYLRQRDLTEERFVPDPFVPGERMYRTGDVAQWRDDGVLVFLGRSDHQVKIRGVRIEPGEIEAAIDAVPHVARAVVVARDLSPGDKQLVAYVVPAPGASLDLGALREHLQRRLPDALVPTSFVVLDELPLTRSGKLDRAVLPVPVSSPTPQGRPPSTPTERLVAELFAEMLPAAHGPATLGVDDDFFACGGHSLTAARVIARVRQQWRCDLGLGVLFAHPTVAKLAAQIEASAIASVDVSAGERRTASNAGLQPMLALVDASGSAAPLFCIHPAGGLSWCYGGLARALSPARRVYGLQAPALDPTVPLPERLEDLASHYVALIRTTQPRGPYHLTGWSIGGIIAHAMAVVLQGSGDTVGTLAMLDAYPSDRWRSQPEPEEGAALRALLLIAGVTPVVLAGARLTQDAVVGFLRQSGHPLGELSNATLAAMIRVVERNNRLVRAYEHQRYHGQVLYFRAALDHRDDGLDPSQWSPYVDGAIDVHDVLALHAHLTGAEAVSSIAPVLSASLNRWP